MPHTYRAENVKLHERLLRVEAENGRLRTLVILTRGNRAAAPHAPTAQSPIVSLSLQCDDLEDQLARVGSEDEVRIL
jgi:hypothetical protein